MLVRTTNRATPVNYGRRLASVDNAPGRSWRYPPSQAMDGHSASLAGAQCPLGNLGNGGPTASRDVLYRVPGLNRVPNCLPALGRSSFGALLFPRWTGPSAPSITFGGGGPHQMILSSLSQMMVGCSFCVRCPPPALATCSVLGTRAP